LETLNAGILPQSFPEKGRGRDLNKVSSIPVPFSLVAAV